MCVQVHSDGSTYKLIRWGTGAEVPGRPHVREAAVVDGSIWADPACDEMPPSTPPRTHSTSDMSETTDDERLAPSPRAPRSDSYARWSEALGRRLDLLGWERRVRCRGQRRDDASREEMPST